MRYFLFIFLLFGFAATAKASDSLVVSLNKSNLNKGDTLDFSCVLSAGLKQKLPTSTLNVWIDNTVSHKRWKFRYPVVDGEVNASLVIGDSIPKGDYAVNFVLQQGFLKVNGEVLQHNKKDTAIYFMMITRKQNQPYLSKTRVEKSGSFRLSSTLFADSAYFIFTPSTKSYSNYLLIQIETPLDSAFIPITTQTQFISIGKQASPGNVKSETNQYVFSYDNIYEDVTLPGVTVKAKYKTQIQQFNEEYSRGLFDDPDSRIFDGLTSRDIQTAHNFYIYLMNRVPGMTLNEHNIPIWRRFPIKFYLDEFPIDYNNLLYISAFDIAMIKVYEPPSHVGGYFNTKSGAVAVYTKQGKYETSRSTRHNFIVKGYTNMESVWR